MDIKFITEDPNLVDYFSPVPTRKFLPDWFKDLPQTNHCEAFKGDIATIKTCVPVTDFMTSGYIIKNAWETDLQMLKDPNSDNLYHEFRHPSYNENYISGHYHEQCPINIKGNNRSYFKISNDWLVRTPPGYSCLFFQPFYFFEERYTLFPAIIDTDKYDTPVQFTGVVNTSENETITIKPGDPLIQAIPFKREDWKMEVSMAQTRNSLIRFFMRRENNPVMRLYKNLFHSKKKFD